MGIFFLIITTIFVIWFWVDFFTVDPIKAIRDNDGTILRFIGMFLMIPVSFAVIGCWIYFLRVQIN